MDNTILSILLIIIGLFLGIGFTFLINHFRVNNAESKIKTLSEKAQKESEKVKREGVGDHASCGTIRILLSKEMQRAEWWRVPEGSYWACDYSITKATYLR